MDVPVEALPTAQAGALHRSGVRGLVERAGSQPWLHVSWSAFWRSRVLIWLSGCLAMVLFGTNSGASTAFDPTRISSSFGSLGNVLAAPAVRWDSIWYLQIAHSGYQTARETAFFPLYPLLIKGGAFVTGSAVIAAIAISLAALLAGLCLLHRLTQLELGERAAGAAVYLVAFGPMALFLSAVYTESLFLALSAGTFLAARRGRWAFAGALAGLGAMTRVTGILLVVPLLVLFFYGPRADVPPAARDAWWKPRYRLSRCALWLALAPAGAALFAAYLAVRGFGALSMLHAQEQFSAHHLVGPLSAVWEGARAAWHELVLEASGTPPSTYASQALLQFAVLAVAAIAAVGVLKRLPLAYGAYVVVGLLVPLSSPTVGDPLRGLDRYAAILFPLYMWAGVWCAERRVTRTVVLATGAGLVLFTVQFATWHWVGSTSI